MGGFLGLGVGPDVGPDLNPVDLGEKAFSAAKDGLGWLGGQVKHHWKAIVAVTAGVLVATAVTAIIIGSCGTAAPALVGAAVASGFLGSGTTQLTKDELNGQRPGLDVVESAAIGGVVGGATFGLGRFVLAPALDELLPAPAAGIVRNFVPGGVVPTGVKDAVTRVAAPNPGQVFMIVTDHSGDVLGDAGSSQAAPAVKNVMHATPGLLKKLRDVDGDEPGVR